MHLLEKRWSWCALIREAVAVVCTRLCCRSLWQTVSAGSLTHHTTGDLEYLYIRE